MSVNKAIIIGRLGRDPEVKYLNSGDPVASFSVATSESWKDKSGERKEKTEWHRVVAFRKLAEICGAYLSKGSQVYVEGKLQTREWEKDGVKRSATEIVANEMRMLDPKGSAAAKSQDHGEAQQAHYAAKANAYQNPDRDAKLWTDDRPRPVNGARNKFPEDVHPGDDIPF